MASNKSVDPGPKKQAYCKNSKGSDYQRWRELPSPPCIRKIIDLLQSSPEEIVLEMSNPKFGFDAYLNANGIDINDFEFVHKILLLVQKALTCSSLKLKLNYLMTKFCDSELMKRHAYKHIDIIEININNRVIGKLSSNAPFKPKIHYNESFIKTVILVSSQIIDLNPNFKSFLEPILDRLELIILFKINDNSLKQLYERTLLFSISKSERRLELEHIRVVGSNEPSDMPESFLEMSVVPTLNEILSEQAAYLRQNLVDGPYRGVNHYLDVHFRLLREDFIQPLREAIFNFRQIVAEATESNSNRKKAIDMVKNTKNIESLNVYTNVTIESSLLSDNGIVYMVKLNSYNTGSINWRNTKRLMYGSLVCLSSDYFMNQCLMGTVCVRDVDLLRREGVIIIKFDFEGVGNSIERLPKYGCSYTMLENSAYFEPYRHVLKALQVFGNECEADFPFRDEIVFLNRDNDQPAYLRNAKVDFRVSHNSRPLVDHRKNEETVESYVDYDDSLMFAQLCFMNNLDSWPTPGQMKLDASQYQALKLALQNRIALIQGPPGTGKTFIGVKLVQFLIQNSNLWRKDKIRPILMVCYTNHALDQFLECCVKECGLTSGVVRVGGRCKNSSLEKFLLSNLRARYRQERAFDSRIYLQYSTTKNQLSRMMKHIENESHLLEVFFRLRKTQIMRLEYLKMAIDQTHYNELRQSSDVNNNNEGEKTPTDWDLLKWMGFFDQRNQQFISNSVPRQSNPTQNNSHIDKLFQQETHPKQKNEKKTQSEETGDDYDDDGDENEERILEAFEANISMQTKLEENKIHDKDKFKKNFFKNSDILNLCNSIKKPKNNRKQTSKFIDDYVKTIVTSSDRLTEDQVSNCKSIWELSIPERLRLYNYWLAKYEYQLMTSLNDLQREFNLLTNVMIELKMQLDKSIMERAMIVAMTTTGSSRYSEILKDIGPHIVIVEEAAEVFEAHIISSLSKNCQHLILIGDHLQLRPNPTVYKLALHYKLDVSLFERLVKNKFRSVMLNCQHRMRPDISIWSKIFYDQVINDHESVLTYPDVRGIKTNVYFLNHCAPESEHVELRSKRNKFEANFVSKMCQFLLKQDYESSQITVITMYLGQLVEIRSELRRLGLADKIRVSTVDNFQGEENDIIILSLVRSNLDSAIGFLKAANRICVALSRAKYGLYCIGNMDLISMNSEKWSRVVEMARERGILGSSLPVCCGHHPENDFDINIPLDFDRRPDGGCNLPCLFRLSCGHKCSKFCHTSDPDHVKYKCTKPCSKIISWCGHYCRLPCSHAGECGECGVIVKKQVDSCGHFVNVRCDKEPNRSDCCAPCEKRIEKCGHRCQRQCGDPDCDKCLFISHIDPVCRHQEKRIKAYCYEPFWLAQEKCNLSCNQALLSCGHLCSSTCGGCFGGRVHRNCREKCNRILFCGHKCKTPCAQQCRPCALVCQNRCAHSKCGLKCSQPCKPCLEKCSWRCVHSACTKLCHELCDREPCNKPCNKRLKCGHSCVGFCGEPCPKLCRVCDETELARIFFGTEDDPDARFVLLEDCKHVVEAEGMLRWLEEGQKSNLIQLPECPKCRTPMRRNLRFSKFVKTQLMAIEQIKLKQIGDAQKIREIKDEISLDFKKASQSQQGKKSDIWYDLLDKIHQTSIQQDINQNDLIALKNAFRIGKRLREFKAEVADYFSDYKDQNYEKHLVYEIDKMRSVLLDENWRVDQGNLFTVTTAKTDEILGEIKRIEYVFKMYKYRHTFETILTAWKMGTEYEINNLLGELNQRLVRSVNGFKDQNRLLEIFSKLERLIDVKISESLRIEVVKAMEVKKGAWFKCPNGHPYCIDRCGGAMEISYCADCKAPIGGIHHRLLEDNRLAGEMDDAQFPAYSEIANRMENFNLNDIN